MVDDLTEKGYVIRTRDLSDRRKYLISITDKGMNLASDFMEKLSQKLEDKLSKLNDEDIKRYRDAINTLEDILNQENFR